MQALEDAVWRLGQSRLALGNHKPYIHVGNQSKPSTYKTGYE